MNRKRIKQILQAASDLSPEKGRALVAAASKAQKQKDALDAIRSGLDETLKPIGQALEMALASGDQPALLAALRLISSQMPSLIGPSAAFEEAIRKDQLTAFTEL